MRISELFNNVYDESVGWRPVSGNVKPVHVANGLLRALTGTAFDTSRLNRFLVPWKQKRGNVLDDARTFAALVEADRAGKYEAFRDRPREFERARRYAFGLLAADNGVFPSADNSAMTLTCAQVITRAPNDRGLGIFGRALLVRDGRPGPLAEAVTSAIDVSRTLDPLTALIWPLLEERGREIKSEDKLGPVVKGRRHTAIISQLSDAAATLASHERAQGNRLSTLQRTTHFVCVATLVHAQALAADGKLEKRIPGLLALSGHAGGEIAVASERSVDRIFDHFERWLGEQLAERIEHGRAIVGDELIEATSDGRKARGILSRIGSAKKSEEQPSDAVLDARRADFEQAQREVGRDEPARVIATALLRSYLREFESGGPRPFLQSLGRKVGLLYPHFQGRAREKRIRPSAAILDLLVRCCVEQGTVVPLDAFLERLWLRFGLIVGGRRTADWDDYEVLTHHGIDIDMSTLATNLDVLVDQLVQMGLARRYADNVTFVGDGYVA